MAKTKLDQFTEVDRNIQVKEENKKYIIEDAFKNISSYTAEEFVMYYGQVYQNVSSLINDSQNGVHALQKQIERIWIQIEQSETLMKSLKPLVAKARAQLALEQKQKERVGKKEEKEQGTG